MELAWFPPINASLNAASAVLLLLGYGLIRGGHRRSHAVCMVSAFALSIVFLACYLYYHYHYGHTVFPDLGWIRTVYLIILFSHIMLAVLVPFLAVITLWRALQQRFDRHRSIARYLLPVWLYVSVTGVIIYFMLYHLV